MPYISQITLPSSGKYVMKDSIARAAAGSNFKKRLQYLAAGYGPLVFPTGLTIATSKTLDGVTRNFDMQVMDLDYHTPVDTRILHTCTLMMKDIYEDAVFDFPEALIKVVSGLEAGSHFCLTLYKSGGNNGQDGLYGGTTTQAIPAGGYIRHTTIGETVSSPARSQVLSGQWITYDTSFQEIERIATDADDNSGTDFGTSTSGEPGINSDHVNYSRRNFNGSARLLTSFILQYLNSSGTGWWQQKTEFDFPPNNYLTKKGFLTGLDEDMLESMLTVKIRTERMKADGVGYDDIETKVFPASVTELGLGKNSNEYETSYGLDNTLKTTPLAFWDGATSADRIKKRDDVAGQWMTRSNSVNMAQKYHIMKKDGGKGVAAIASGSFGIVAVWAVGYPSI